MMFIWYCYVDFDIVMWTLIWWCRHCYFVIWTLMLCCLLFDGPWCCGVYCLMDLNVVVFIVWWTLMLWCLLFDGPWCCCVYCLMDLNVVVVIVWWTLMTVMLTLLLCCLSYDEPWNCDVDFDILSCGSWYCDVFRMIN
jgi:hypothetical protein